MLALVPASPAHSETGGRTVLDSETLTSKAVNLISRLQQVEQQLLYPAYTHVSVFLSVAENSQAGLLSVSLEIDDNRVTDHIYNQKETAALNAGGIQRLYTGNVLTGKHRLRVSLKQAREDGGVSTHELEYEFTKDESAEHIEIIFDNERPQIVGQSRG
jgi:GTP-dependent phosphoenolpyruvate carboxykinase